MSIQTFDWGYIHWIYEANKDGNIPIYIGISHMKPNIIQGSHIHYGDEQIMYILQGKGKQYINGIEYEIQENAWFRIGIGSSHETVNEGEEEIIKLLISFPKNDKIGEKYRLEMPDNCLLELSDIMDKVKIKDKLNFPVTILSKNDTVIYSSNFYTEYCNKKCSINKNPLNCELMVKKNGDKSPQYSHVNSYRCENNISVFNKPIVYNNELLGYVVFGHISEYAMNIQAVETNIPKSTVAGVITIMNDIVETILDVFEIELTKIVLRNNNKDINNYIKQEEQMKKDLDILTNEMLSIKINNHFLFNTLNAIANLSIKGDKLQTYKSIIELSKLFRYSVEKGHDLVMLIEEMDHVKNYIELQKLRYNKRFSINYNISKVTLSKKIPFNILQPIVENIYIHSSPKSNKNIGIKITTELKNGFLFIEIADNGKGMEKDKLRIIKSSFTEDNENESGLIMVYKKLRRFYGDNFTMKINSVQDIGTKVLVKIPIEE